MGSGVRGRALRYDERRKVNKKKIHRLWREEGLQVKVVSPRKRAGVSSIPPIEADAPNVVWAIDFQFDSTIDGKAIKIASIVDEHTRVSLLNIVERSITAERFVAELKRRCSPRRAGRHRCYGWTTVRSSFLKRCNSSATERRECPTFRRGRRGITIISNRSTTVLSRYPVRCGQSVKRVERGGRMVRRQA